MPKPKPKSRKRTAAPPEESELVLTLRFSGPAARAFTAAMAHMERVNGNAHSRLAENLCAHVGTIVGVWLDRAIRAGLSCSVSSPKS